MAVGGGGGGVGVVVNPGIIQTRLDKSQERERVLSTPQRDILS